MNNNDNTTIDDNEEPVVIDAAAIPADTNALVDTNAPAAGINPAPVKYAALAGAGIGIGALSMGFKGAGVEEPAPEKPVAGVTNNLAQTHETVIHDHADLAKGVNDSMTFGHAFHAARAEEGAGGVFEWRGQYYNTYYKEEWAAMSHDQKLAYAHSIDHLAEPVAFHPLPPAAQPVAEVHHDVHHDNTPPVVVVVDETHTPTDSINQGIAANPHHAEPAVAQAEHMPVDVIPVEHVVEMDIDGVPAIVHLNGDGVPDAIYIDQDHNHIPEMIMTPDPAHPGDVYIVVDDNQDHIIDAQDVLHNNETVTQDEPMPVEEISHDTHQTSYETGGDFDNHANMEDWGQDNHPVTYDDSHHDPTAYEPPIDDFDNHADMSDWG